MEYTQYLPEVERIGDMDDDARRTDGVNPFSILIMKCAVAARSPGARVSKEFLEELLETLLSAWVVTDCPAFFHSDSSQPGLVSALVRDKTVYVPIQLAPLFPTGKSLEELVDRAEEVRAMTDSTICLSGSHVFGISSAVDTDYCEYVLHTGRRLAGSFTKLASGRSSLCVTVRHFGNRLTGPQVLTNVMTLCQTDSGKVGDVCTCKPRNWKFEYFCLIPTAPTIVTNLCVHEEDCEEFSWAYQEAAITAAGQPLRQLVDSLQLGRYVGWLRKEIEEYTLGNPLKGLKRAFSLCRILFLKQLSNLILELLNSPTAVQIAKNDAERDVTKLQRRLPPEVQNRISAPASEGGNNVSEDGFRIDANSILIRVIEQYDNLFQSAERLVNV